MVSLEVDHNLRILRAFRNEVNEGDESSGIPLLETVRFARGQRLIKSTLPQWNRMVWESQTSLWPVALRDREIQTDLRVSRSAEHYRGDPIRTSGVRS